MEWKDIPELGKRLLDELCDYVEVDKKAVLETSSRRTRIGTARTLLIKYLVIDNAYPLKDVAKLVSFKNVSSVYAALSRADKLMIEDVNLQIIYQRSQHKFTKLNLQPASHPRKARAICQMTANGRIIKRWAATSVAARALGVSRSCISRALTSNETLLSQGYKWKYE